MCACYVYQEKKEVFIISVFGAQNGPVKCGQEKTIANFHTKTLRSCQCFHSSAGCKHINRRTCFAELQQLLLLQWRGTGIKSILVPWKRGASYPAVHPALCREFLRNIEKAVTETHLHLQLSGHSRRREKMMQFFPDLRLFQHSGNGCYLCTTLVGFSASFGALGVFGLRLRPQIACFVCPAWQHSTWQKSLSHLFWSVSESNRQ
jgi:hypothetical protein